MSPIFFYTTYKVWKLHYSYNIGEHGSYEPAHSTLAEVVGGKSFSVLLKKKRGVFNPQLFES